MFKNQRGRPAYKFWTTFVKNEYGISMAYANKMLHAAIIEQELGLPEAIHIRESVLRVMWSVDRDVDVNKMAYGIAQGIAAKQALSKSRRSMPISAKIMEEALLIASRRDEGCQGDWSLGEVRIGDEYARQLEEAGMSASVHVSNTVTMENINA
jgi:hypothetical protein